MNDELLINAAVLRYCGAAAFDSKFNIENSQLEFPFKEMITVQVGAYGQIFILDFRKR